MALTRLPRLQIPSKSMQNPCGLMWNDPRPFCARPVMSPQDHSPSSTTASRNQRFTRDCTMAKPLPFLRASLNLSPSTRRLPRRPVGVGGPVFRLPLPLSLNLFFGSMTRKPAKPMISLYAYLVGGISLARLYRFPFSCTPQIMLMHPPPRNSPAFSLVPLISNLRTSCG